jgi:AcrR family transcriptional regulator
VQARSEATVAAILTAARSVLHEGGEFTARTVAARAGIAPASMYRYFTDTDDVIDALLVEHATAAEAMVGEVLGGDSGADTAAAMRAVLDGYLALYRARPQLTVVWASATMADRQRVIEEVSDRSLAAQLAAHLVRGGALRSTNRMLAQRLATLWQMAGVALGAVLAAPNSAARRLAEEDLRAFVDYAAARLAERG